MYNLIREKKRNKEKQKKTTITPTGNLTYETVHINE